MDDETKFIIGGFSFLYAGSLGGLTVLASATGAIGSTVGEVLNVVHPFFLLSGGVAGIIGLLWIVWLLQEEQ